LGILLWTPGSLLRDMARVVREPEFFCVLPGAFRRACHKRAITAGDTSCLLYLSHRTGYTRVSSSLIEESVMGNIAWPSVASPLFARW
jgi:hypothetical protein